MFEIGHECKSMTETPGFCIYKGNDGEGQEVYLIDCPGLNDTDRTKEYSNRTIVHFIMQRANSLKLCILLTGAQFATDRAQPVLIMMTTISRLLSNNGRLSFKQLCLPFLVNESSITSPMRLKNSF